MPRASCSTCSTNDGLKLVKPRPSRSDSPCMPVSRNCSNSWDRLSSVRVSLRFFSEKACIVSAITGPTSALGLAARTGFSLLK